MLGKDLSQGAKRQGQWIRAEPGNGWSEGGAGPEAGPSPVRLAPAQALSGRWGRASVVRGPWRAESRRVPAKGGGAASVKSGAPAGRGSDAGCCGAGGRADGDVTGLPLASLPSSGGQVAGRPAARPRPRGQRDLRTVRAGGQGRGLGAPEAAWLRGAARADGGSGVLGLQRSGTTLGTPAPSPESPVVQRAGRMPLLGSAVTGRGHGTPRLQPSCTGKSGRG